MADVEASWRSVWVRGGKIDSATWIGKDVLAWCLGMHIVFYNITLKRESLRRCSGAESGDGVSCLSGHPVIRVLAFAEKNFGNQKILVLSYPSMKIVSECVQSGASGYVATAFTSTEYLISLATQPTNSLTVWCWRTGERITSVETPISDIEGQIIEVAYCKSPLVAQLGRRSGKLHMWEMSPAGRTILLSGRNITLPEGARPYRADWSLETYEPQLAIVDCLANIYIANHDGSQVFRAVLTQRCGVCPDYEAPSIRWFRDGIVLRTTFCQIRFYKKDDKNSWRREWYVKSILKPSVLSVHPSRNARLFYHTLEGYLMELSIVEGQESPVIERKLHCGGIYSFLDIVHPWGHHLLAIDDTVQLSVLNSYDGREVARLDLGLEGTIMQMLSHPDYPLAAVTSEKGELVLLSLHTFERPSVIGKFNLQSERLDLLKFSQCGNYLVVGQRTSGICYCLDLRLDQPFVVISRLKAKCRMADVLLYDTRGHLKLLVLSVSSKKITVGHHLIVYELSTDRRDSVEPLNYLELPRGYQFLRYAPDGVRSLIATSYLSRQIHRLEIKDWREVNLADAMVSGHVIRRARLWTDRHWITSSAFDGRVILRDGETRKITARLQPHHRRDLGAIKAVARSSGDLVVSLGRDGSLVGTRSFPKDDFMSLDLPNDSHVIDFGEYEKKRKSIVADYSSLESNIIKLLSRRTGEFPPPKDGIKQTWVEWCEDTKILEDAAECAEQKMALRSDLEKIQTKVGQLLDHNEICPEIERVPIATFDLDKATRDSRLKAAREEREDARLELEVSCMSMDRVTNWIRATYWDPQKVIGRSLFTIFDDIEVTNYSSTVDHPDTKDMLSLARFFKDAARTVTDTETFFPWKLYTSSQMQLALRRKSILHSSDERQRMDALLAVEDDDDKEANADEIEDRSANEGMTTHRFVDQSDCYSQFECYGFAQFLVNSRNLVNDCAMLREYFNKVFDDAVASKEREVSAILERHGRIRYIDSELRTMFGEFVPKLPVDPDWNEKEQPDGIVKVLDREVKVKPYVSPSQQELLDKQAFEAERLRQLSLADDFRERALMRMMDGVLEVRWEDIIKRDVPKPQCMLIKSPEEYDAEDLLAIRQYDQEVEFLETERTRYHRMLETEQIKIKSTLQEITEKFNAKIHDLFLLKMHIESAIQQANLRNLRDLMRHDHRMRCLTMDDETRGEIAEKTMNIGRLSEELRTLQDLVHEYRNEYEAMSTREKNMEKKFRSDFPSLSKSSVELLQKEYKRHPRISMKNFSASDFLDLSRSVASRIKVNYTSHECAEYLKSLELMDIRPSSLPANIDNHHWDHLIRIRRNRIELEMKMRSQTVDIQETEKTITLHDQKILKVNADVDRLKERLIARRQERIDFDRNMEVQFVLKMGQIQLQPGGRRDDTRDALLIPRSEIESVNEMIVNAGHGKLKTMNHAINFRRGILSMEWEHRCLKMKIEDLEEELHTIEGVQVTRNMREFLKRRQDGSKDDNTLQQLEKELETVRKLCQRQFSDWTRRLRDTEAKIENAKRANDSMVKKITRMNLGRWELESQRDTDGEMRRLRYHDRVMLVIKKRAKLVRQLHQDYTEVLALQTEHELLRLRKFPVLNFFRTLDD